MAPLKFLLRYPFPPFNIVLSESGGAPDPRLFEVTWFKNFNYRGDSYDQADVKQLGGNHLFFRGLSYP